MLRLRKGPSNSKSGFKVSRTAQLSLAAVRLNQMPRSTLTGPCACVRLP